MPSIVLRIILALTVLMPPGTYRSLQMLVRQDSSASGAGHLSRQNANSEAPAGVCVESASGRVPIRARNWSQVTFTCAEHWEARQPSATDVVHYLILEMGPSKTGIAAVDGPERSPRSIYSSPRAALLALHKLLS